jgi:ribosomal protein L37E
MVEYEREVGIIGKKSTIKGDRCNRCGFTSLDNDEDVWSAVGL